MSAQGTVGFSVRMAPASASLNLDFSSSAPPALPCEPPPDMPASATGASAFSSMPLSASMRAMYFVASRW